MKEIYSTYAAHTTVMKTVQKPIIN